MAWWNFFKKDLREEFLSFSPEGSTWRVVSWNHQLEKSGQRTWQLDVKGKSEITIRWIRDELDTICFYKNGKLLKQDRKSKDQLEFSHLMNLCFHGVIKYSLEEKIEHVLAPVSGVTAEDYHNEARALQWIQASFGTLSRAMDKMPDKKELILSGMFFAGLEPETQKQVLRLMIFNLDIFCYFLPDQSLQLAIFDDKNLGHGTAKTPSFQQNIKVTKPQIYDEIVKITNRVANLGEIN